jgi:hypothetical protein
MIANALRLDIERYAEGVRRKNPLFTKAVEGTLTPGHVASYLENVRYLIQHNCQSIAIAQNRARDMGDLELADHYAHRLAEEEGHDAWAEEDLATLAPRLSTPPSGNILASMVELVTYVQSRARALPTALLAYLLFGEYLTVIIGPDWLRVLEERCGVGSGGMTVIAKHAELDRGHVEHALEEIDDLVEDPAMLGPMRDLLQGTMARFDDFCAEVTLDEHGSVSGSTRREASAA